jgi:hypothetical protein
METTEQKHTKSNIISQKNAIEEK